MKRLSMPFPKLERVKARHREAAGLLDSMANYVCRQMAAHEEFVIPKLAAADLGLSEGEAFVLLKMMADEDVVKQQFNVYCRTHGILLQSVDKLDGLDDIKWCDFCDRQHGPNELFVEIAFRLSEKLGASDLAA